MGAYLEIYACNVIADGSSVQGNIWHHEWSNNRISKSGTVFSENKCRYIPFDVFTDTAEKFISNCVRTDSDGNSTNPEQLH